ncbi:MAG: hypothetical protein ACT4RN_02880 [Pseudonocardia sp.]
MVVTGYDDRSGCGYVLRTGADVQPGTPTVEHLGVTVSPTAELAALLRDALARHSTVQLDWGGPAVPLTLDDPTILAWLQHTVGGVLTVAGDPA